MNMSELSTVTAKKIHLLRFYQSELGRGKSFQNLIDDPIGEERRQTQLHLAETQKKMLNSRVQTHALMRAHPPTHTYLILLTMSTPDCSRRVLVTKLLGTTILDELACISSVRRLALFIT